MANSQQDVLFPLGTRGGQLPGRALAFYGKGGIGKTTISSNISVAFSQAGGRVLHIGCDPKSDSCFQLLGHKRPVTVMGLLRETRNSSPVKEDFLATGPSGVDCIECGGPEAGIGCAGRGITKTLEIVKAAGIFESPYSAVVFDVLGDLVCGGFAAPMRLGYAREVYIVVSGEIMTLWAANNLARAVARYSHQGVCLGGIIPNLRKVEAEREVLAAFARSIGARLLPALSRRPAYGEAERLGRTVLETAPESAAADEIRALFATIDATQPDECASPTPLSDEAFEAFISEVKSS